MFTVISNSALLTSVRSTRHFIKLTISEEGYTLAHMLGQVDTRKKLRQHYSTKIGRERRKTFGRPIICQLSTFTGKGPQPWFLDFAVACGAQLIRAP